MSTTNQALLYSGTGTGTTTPISPSDREGSTIRLQLVLTSTGTIAWEHTVDGTNWVPINAVNENTLASATSATASGIYTINASASYQVRGNISANGSGLLLTGTVVRGGGGGSSSGGSGGGGAVTLASGAVASGAYSAGSIAAGAGVDGWDLNAGATTDGAVTTNTTGTLSGKLRGLVAIFADVWVSASHYLKVRVTDGTNSMPAMDAATRPGFFTPSNGTTAMFDVAARSGFVIQTDGTNTAPTMDVASRAGFFKQTDGTNTMPTADAIARALYARLTDGTTAVGVDAGTTGLKVAIAADLTSAPTSPLLVQLTDATNGTNVTPVGDTVGRAIFFKQTDGTNTAAVKAASTAAAATDPATVVSISPNSVGTVGGTTTIVGVEITRPADTTAYAVGDSVNTSTSAPTFIDFANLSRLASGTGYITKVRLETDQAACVAQMRLWLFNANSGTKSNDNAAFTLAYADKALALGYIDIPALAVEGSSNVATAQDATLRVAFSAAAGKSVYGLLETKTIFTPASGQKFYVELTGENN